MKLNILDTVDEVLQRMAEYFVLSAKIAIEEKGQFSVALSGGSSPKKLYELLTTETYKDDVDWKNVYFFFGDERYVPATDADSNYLMAKNALFEPLHIDASQVFAVDTTLPPEEAAADYMAGIEEFFEDEPCSFDLVLLGLGDNSHTASLFPYTDVLHDESISVKSVFLKEQDVYRITFTAPLINQAQRIAFLVYGAGKAEAVHHILEDERDIDNYPAQLIVPVGGHVQWFLDKAAAASLQKES